MGVVDEDVDVHEVASTATARKTHRIRMG